MTDKGPGVAAAVTVLVLAIHLAGCSNAETSADPEPPSSGSPVGATPTDPGAELDATVTHLQDMAVHHDLSIPGGVVLVATGDTVRSFAFGEAELRPKRAMKVTDRFAIGSITKMMVATVVLQPVEDGTLTLDDTVEKWVPDLLEKGDKITLEELLSHRSGVHDITNDGPWRWETDLTVDRLRRLLARPLDDPPGTTSSYSNSNYMILGKIIEAATSRPIAGVLQERVFDPAGMTTASFATDLEQEPDLARGYDKQDRDVTLGDFTGIDAAGEVVASAADVGAFFLALHSGRLLPEAAVTDMSTSRGTLEDGPDYGLGISIVYTDCADDISGHFGEVPGFLSAALYNPGTDRTAVTLVNTNSDRGLDTINRLTQEGLCF